MSLIIVLNSLIKYTDDKYVIKMLWYGQDVPLSLILTG